MPNDNCPTIATEACHRGITESEVLRERQQAELKRALAESDINRDHPEQPMIMEGEENSEGGDSE